MTYNGILRRLLVSNVKGPPTESVAPHSKLSASPEQIFSISRATTFIFKSPIAPLPKKKVIPSNPVNSNGANGKDGELGGYEALGGMEAQIEQIRELVEWPLTRPELYNHFGELTSIYYLSIRILISIQD